MDIDKAEQYIFDKLSRELPNTLHYHSVAHIKDVLNAAENIAGNEGVSGNDLIMLKTAAMYHDAGFVSQNNDHESISCDIVRGILPKFNYYQEQIEKICGMIMATKIPQLPKSLLEQIICDADLDYLGREDYFKISGYLFNEFNETSKLGESDWLNIQINFFEQHHYFTKTSIKARKHKKNIHLAALKKMLKNISI